MNSPKAGVERLTLLLRLFAIFLAVGTGAVSAEERKSDFDDPFLQVTAGVGGCPTPQEPVMTEREMRAAAHSRAERGTSCFLDGRCRLPNSYLYDKEIVPRVKKAILADGRFASTSIWVEGRRRWVWLKGCVRSPDQIAALKQLVAGIEDVQAVISELVVMRVR